VGTDVLVVDDDEGIRHLLAHVLSREQCRVEATETVLGALAKLAEQSFDLAIVDLMLPEINGLQLAEAIQILDPGTPVILITAYGTTSFEDMVSHPAIAHYVHKPFELGYLMTIIRQSLARRRTK
jgi:two-component system response regulator AtoC